MQAVSLLARPGPGRIYPAHPPTTHRRLHTSTSYDARVGATPRAESLQLQALCARAIRVLVSDGVKAGCTALHESSNIKKKKKGRAPLRRFGATFTLAACLGRFGICSDLGFWTAFSWLRLVQAEGGGHVSTGYWIG